jgi:lipopolysaccharide/colanic/teichoic acid biosynthesis glycosyltransferase
MSAQNLHAESASIVNSRTSETPVLPVARKRQFHELLLKRLLDILGSGLLLVLLSPLLLVLAFLVRRTDGTPIIHRRRVVGPNGEFDAYKLRTMVPNADALLSADPGLRLAFSEQFKLKSDPRVTQLGAWLRKYSLDELPQLLNVLKGQMSLVGPRMITAPELEKYGIYRDLLLSVKPGLTGYWQIRGRQDVSYEERVRMDMHYITNWNLLLDVAILLQTPAKVIFGRGAY